MLSVTATFCLHGHCAGQSREYLDGGAVLVGEADILAVWPAGCHTATILESLLILMGRTFKLFSAEINGDFSGSQQATQRRS